MLNNDVKIINNDEYATRFPKTNQDYVDLLDEESKDMHLNLYSIYNYLLTSFITNKLSLKSYDDELSNSELNFLKVQPSEMDIYQYLSSDLLNYYYLRNNLYIERLSVEQKMFLFKKLSENNLILDTETEKFIEETYQIVIFEDINKDGSLSNVNYGPINPKFYAPNNALVLGVRFDDYNLNGLTDGEWGKLHDQQKLFLNEQLEKLYVESQGKLDIPININIYTEYSIKKKESNLATSSPTLS